MKNSKAFPLFSLTLFCLAALTTAVIRTPRSGVNAAVSTATTANAQNVGLVGHIGGSGTTVFVEGNYAYVGLGSELAILDVADPTQPDRVGYVVLPEIVQDICVAGGHAYIADDEGGLRVIDISDPTNPVEVGLYDSPGDARGIAAAGDYAYIADGSGSLRVVDVSDPTVPIEVGFHNTPSHALDVIVMDDYVYVTWAPWYGLPIPHPGGMRIMDISDPTTPVEVGFYDTLEIPVEVAVAGDYAYITVSHDGLRVVDVSNPASPAEVSHVSGSFGDVAMAGDYAYIAGGSGLWLVDISDPTAPVVVSFHGMPVFVTDVVVASGYAYVADYAGGLRVMDISDPTVLTEVGSYNVPGDARAVVVAGGYAYVADGAGGLQMVDAANSVAPGEVSFFDTPGYAYGVSAAGGYAYVADGEAGLRVVDVSNPANPTEVGFYDTPGYAYGVAAAGDCAYVAYGWQGLFIFVSRQGFSITGQITDLNNRPFPGIVVSAGVGLNTSVEGTGAYTFTNLLAETYTLTPKLTGYAFWPSTRSVMLPPDARGQNFTILPRPVSTRLVPDTATSLVYTDTQGLPTQFDFPIGAVTQTTTVTLTPTLASRVAGFAFAGHAFELTALQDSRSLPGFVFGKPVTVTLHYSSDDMWSVTDESQLALWWWMGSEWQDAAQTCDPTAFYTREVTNDMLSVPICQTGQFGLFGPTYELYLPPVFPDTW